jgi:hypothetical protein
MRESHSLLNNLENFDKVFTTSIRSNHINTLSNLFFIFNLNSNDSDFHQNHMTTSKMLMNDVTCVSIYDINRYWSIYICMYKT